MALTLEPNLRQSNAVYNNITIEDYMDTIDRVRPEDTPLYSMAGREMDLNNTEFAWNVDTIPTPLGALGVADGEDVTGGNSPVRDATTNMRKMGNIGQGFRRAYGAGWIAQRIPDIAGVGKGNILSRARADAYILLKQDMECAMCSVDQLAYMDSGTATGSLMSGMRKMIDNANSYASPSGFAYGAPTDIQFAPTGAFTTGTSMAASFNLSAMRSMSKALRKSAASAGDYVFLCGLDLREQITFLTDPQTVSATGGALAPTWIRMTKQDISDSELGISIDVVRTDFGRFAVVETRFIGTTTTNSTGGAVASSGNRATRTFLEVPKSAYILKKGMFAKRWGVPMFEMPLPDNGGGDQFDVKCYAGLVVYNPMYFGMFYYTG